MISSFSNFKPSLGFASFLMLGSFLYGNTAFAMEDSIERDPTTTRIIHFLDIRKNAADKELLRSCVAGKNNEKALSNYKDVIYKLAELYYHHSCDKLQRDFKAIPIYTTLAKDGHPASQYRLGRHYLWWGINIEEGKSLVNLAAENGCFDALKYLYLEVERGENNIEKGMEILHRRALQGCPESRYHLAHIYLEGKYGIEQDIEKGMELLHLGALEGHPASHRSLAAIYEEGRYGVTDYAEAVKWHTLAVEQDHLTSEMRLAKMYKEGRRGVEKNPVEVVKIYTKMLEVRNMPIFESSLSKLFSFTLDEESSVD